MVDTLVEIKSVISSLKGIGPKKSQLLRKIGIETIGDILYSFPRAYEDRRTVKTIASLSGFNLFV